MLKKISKFLWTWFIQGYIFVNILFIFYNWIRTGTFSFSFLFPLEKIILNIKEYNLKGILAFFLVSFLCSTVVILWKYALSTTFNWFVESSWKMRIYIIISSCLIIYSVLRKIL